MAGVKFAGEEAVERIAHYVNKKLNIASTMPSTPNDEDIILYVGESNDSYIQGCIYEYDEINETWKIINSVQTVELTTAEYEALPVSVQNNGTIYFLTDGEGGGGGSTLAGLTDVNISGVTNGQVIKYNSTTHKWENDDESGAGGILPHLIVISETGSTVTATKGQTVITATETSTGHFECDLTELGTWTIDAILGGDDAQVSLVVDTVKVYTVDDSHFHATVTVKYPEGATCRLQSADETLYATGSPYTFTVHHAETYTITVTYNQRIYTDTVTFTTEGQSFSKTLPSPSEVDANDINSWLFFGGVSGTFTTLSEILANSTALSTLMASTDAVDYLVRCTSWISDICGNQSAMSYIGLNNYCANTLLADSDWFDGICNSEYFESVLNVKVPTMTSNTAPSGECSSKDSTAIAYKAFNGNISDHASPLTDTQTNVENWLYYKFANPVSVHGFSLKDIASGYSIHTITFKIQASNDANTWTDLYSDTSYRGSTDFTVKKKIINSESYLYYRILYSSGLQGANNYYFSYVYEAQFYGRTNL